MCRERCLSPPPCAARHATAANLPSDAFPPRRLARKQLCSIPNTQPPAPYHSLAALGIYRYNEYVVFHSDQTYPEYLLAFQRV